MASSEERPRKLAGRFDVGVRNEKSGCVVGGMELPCLQWWRQWWSSVGGDQEFSFRCLTLKSPRHPKNVSLLPVNLALRVAGPSGIWLNERTREDRR